MALYIKSEKAEKLAKAVAKLTGESLTQAVTQALEERLVRLETKTAKKPLVDELLEISRQCAALPVLDHRTPDEILGWDGDGLPT